MKDREFRSRGFEVVNVSGYTTNLYRDAIYRAGATPFLQRVLFYDKTCYDQAEK